ncbi:MULTISPECIES: hypothetical protein [Bacillus]|uniref:YhfM-like domain-containing protein n=1 Tax=Bacillus thuringiensis TaxID=1428 RepID=A0A9X6TXI9_BACTU|nr:MULTISPECIES: hypothetical protein [Bacillus]EPF12354.1 hypothetical protein ICA_01671 [Bacillus cereus BAG1O-3]KXX92277.1 hypothetical protein AT266_06080 [Bacillus cereus]MCU4723408.1 hypothetical protein [Bacillus cereus]MDA1556067.1 hypothetical protein [Bacillus cereus]MDC7732976.1 hypothetical protein [Bacillus thuringiensis]
MQMRNLYLVFSVICLFVVTSCSNNIGNHDQTIEVQKHAGDNHYEDLKVITDKNKVLQVKKILNDTNFENKKVEMSRSADYQFVFQFKNPKIEAKAVVYQMWISPNKDKVEIKAEDNQYAQLAEKDTAAFMKIVTGEKLAE